MKAGGPGSTGTVLSKNSALHFFKFQPAFSKNIFKTYLIL